MFSLRDVLGATLTSIRAFMLSLIGWEEGCGGEMAECSQEEEGGERKRETGRWSQTRDRESEGKTLFAICALV